MRIKLSLLLCLLAAHSLWGAEPRMGLVAERPVSGPCVDTDQGFMVPYKTMIPGTKVEFEMLPIPGGKFLLGSPDSEAGHKADEGPQFEVEMRHFVQALGINCGGCHARGNFASEDNPRKATARKMIEMTRSLNQRFFPGFTPAEGETSLGRVTCYTCHQGSAQPKAAAPAPGE